MNPIIKKDQVRAGAGARPGGPRRGHAKVVNLLRADGEVRAIEFRCTCGEVSVIELEYELPDAPAGTTGTEETAP